MFAWWYQGSKGNTNYGRNPVVVKNWDLTTISAQVAARSGISAQRPGIHAMEDNCGKGYP
jgi:hypothetical protein